MKVYRGEIRNAYVKNIEFCEGVAVLTTDSVVVKKDGLFYETFIGSTVNLDFDTCLASEEEAFELLENSARNNPRTNIGSCLYADYANLVREDMPKEEFKKLKRVYKAQTRARKRK